MIKVSVIVPVYNVEKYLNRCLNSLVNQSLKDIEIIIVNDGSKDDSQKIIDQFTNSYPTLIKSYIKENGGLSSARNYGLEKASGKYIAFVDSDDWIDIKMLEKMYDRAQIDNLDIIVCDTIIAHDNSSYIIKSNLEYSKDIIKNYLVSYPMACTRLYKRRLFTEDFLFKEGILYEDLQLTPTFVLKTSKIGFIEEALYYYYQRENSIMGTKKFAENLLDIFYDLDSIKEKFIKYKKYDIYKEEIEFLYIQHLLRSASLRFVEFKDAKHYLDMINDVFRKNYPLWQKNKYYKKTSLKFKLVCYFSYHKQYKILAILKKVSGK